MIFQRVNSAGRSPKIPAGTGICFAYLESRWYGAESVREILTGFFTFSNLLLRMVAYG